MAETLTEKLTKTPEGRRLWQQEWMIDELTELIVVTMQDQGTSKKQLARRVRITEANLTAILAGGVEPSLRTIADIFTALNRSLRLSTGPLEV